MYIKSHIMKMKCSICDESFYQGKEKIIYSSTKFGKICIRCRSTCYNCKREIKSQVEKYAKILKKICIPFCPACAHTCKYCKMIKCEITTFRNKDNINEFEDIICRDCWKSLFLCQICFKTKDDNNSEFCYSCQDEMVQSDDILKILRERISINQK